MAKLPVVSGRDVIKVLIKIGFVTDRVKGSHVFMNILDMAELETDDFVKLLK